MTPPQIKKLWAGLQEMRDVYVRCICLSKANTLSLPAETPEFEERASLCPRPSSPLRDSNLPSECESCPRLLRESRATSRSVKGQAIGVSTAGDASGTRLWQSRVSHALQQVLKPDKSANSHAIEARAVALRERFLRARLLALAPLVPSGERSRSVSVRSRSVSACTPPRLRLRSRSRSRSHGQRLGHICDWDGEAEGRWRDQHWCDGADSWGERGTAFGGA